MKAGDILHDRRCAIGLANEGHSNLTNPHWAFYSGMIHTALPFEIGSGQAGLDLFVKTKGEMLISTLYCNFPDLAEKKHCSVIG